MSWGEDLEVREGGGLGLDVDCWGGEEVVAVVVEGLEGLEGVEVDDDDDAVGCFLAITLSRSG